MWPKVAADRTCNSNDVSGAPSYKENRCLAIGALPLNERRRDVVIRQAADAVDKAIAELADFDLKIEGATQGMPSAKLKSESGPVSYVARHRHEYIRTVSDVLKYRPPISRPVRVLELGA